MHQPASRVTAPPPVTEAEFRDLATWLRANRRRLETQAGDGRCVVQFRWGTATAFNVELMMERGPRTTNAGELAEAVRRLRARYGERTA